MPQLCPALSLLTDPSGMQEETTIPRMWCLTQILESVIAEQRERLPKSDSQFTVT